jgi:hypothetical protein
MTPNPLESEISDKKEAAERRSSGWLRLGLFAAASALAGGLAAAWWHRKTLTKLRQGEENASNPDFRISGSDPPDEA